MDCNNPFKLFVKTSRILRGEYLFFLLWVRTEDGRTSTPTPFCNIYTYREYVYIYMSIYIYIYIQGHIHSKTSHMIPAVKLTFSRLWLDFSALCRSIVNVVEKIIRAFSNIIIYSVNSTYKFMFIASAITEYCEFCFAITSASFFCQSNCGKRRHSCTHLEYCVYRIPYRRTRHRIPFHWLQMDHRYRLGTNHGYLSDDNQKID